MSIINQDIKGGYVTVSRPGYYFNLISASGVVRVVLRKKGEEVLDSKFWVGMSINEPIEYDTIIIYGDDAPVEFWAGKVSMNQSRSSMTGAAAMRTSLKSIRGGKVTQIVGSDLTRVATRVRASSDLVLTGASFSGGGWAVKANDVVEIPVAGVINAYKEPAKIDLTSVAMVSSGDVLPSSSNSYANAEPIVSPDGKKMFVKVGSRVYYKDTDVDDIWREPVSLSEFSPSVVFGFSDGRIFAGHTGVNPANIRFFVSYDYGKTFEHFKTLVFDGSNTQPTVLGVTSTNVIMARYESVTQRSYYSFSLDTREMTENKFFHENANSYTQISSAAQFGDNVLIELKTAYSVYELYYSTDGGKTFNFYETTRSGSTSGFGFVTTESGSVITYNAAAPKCFFECSIVECKDVSASGLYRGYLQELEGVVFYKNSKSLKALSTNNDVIADEVLATTAQSNGYVGVSSGGFLVVTGNGTFNNPYGEIYSFSIDGNPQPASVEVMELLS